MQSSDPPGVIDQTAEHRRCGREWQQFLDTAVHDLNAPLRGIATSASLLSEICVAAANPETAPLLGQLHESIFKMKVLLKGLAEYATALEVDDSSFVAVPLDPVVRSAWAALAPGVQETGATTHASA